MRLGSVGVLGLGSHRIKNLKIYREYIERI